MSSDQWDGLTDRRSSKGFVVRYELLGIIGIMVIQLAGSIWWASSMQTEVKYMRADIVRLTSALETATQDRYKPSDASRAHEHIYATIAKNEVRITNIEYKELDQSEKRLSALENRMR